MSTKRPLQQNLDFDGLMGKLFGPQRDGTVRRGLLARRGRGRGRGGVRLPRPSPPPGSGFRARFGLSRRPEDPGKGGGRSAEATATIMAASEVSFCSLRPILRDGVVPFLAPHELLRLLRCSKFLWCFLGGDGNSGGSAAAARGRRDSVLRSLFAYLRISEEAAENVASSCPGGWRTFAPLLVGLCEDLARTYGHLEPDPAHRSIVAEQACFTYFGDRSRRHGGVGRLAGRDADERDREMRERGLLRPGDEESDEDELVGALVTLTVGHLKSVDCGRVCWGDPDACLVRGDDELGEWLERNLEWMRRHASDTLNEHYKSRLENGLHPPIWIMCRPEMYIEYALAIGPNRDQTVVSFSSFYDSFKDSKGREEKTRTFWSCFDHGRGDQELRSKSFVEFLVSFACSADPCLDAQPSMGMVVWCIRHGLEPFTDESIDWFRFFRDEDPFLFDALTSPAFGLANVDKYKEGHVLEPSLCKANNAVQELEKG